MSPTAIRRQTQRISVLVHLAMSVPDQSSKASQTIGSPRIDQETRQTTTTSTAPTGAIDHSEPSPEATSDRRAQVESPAVSSPVRDRPVHRQMSNAPGPHHRGGRVIVIESDLIVMDSRYQPAARCLVFGNDIGEGEGVTAMYAGRTLRFKRAGCRK